ncbi:pentapeptide repeat-containing protein [Streptomyces lavendofoliae]|uniref:pentapeptide repeat-containing protein n=1 Tax=Streptomyces lavendofoliae TaxID=67314 RepID=UPI003D8A64E4
MPKKLRRILGPLGVTVAIICYAMLLWRGPWLLDGAHIRHRNLQPADGVVITGFRTVLIAFGAAIIAGVGLHYTHRSHRLSQSQFEQSQRQFREQHAQTSEQLRLTQQQLKLTHEQFAVTRKKDREQNEIAREGQVTGRYVEAIKLLGSSMLTERLGGIYSLERIMRDSERDHATVIAVLAAFIRMAASPLGGWVDREAHSSSHPINPPRLSEDIQAALSVLGRRPDRDDQEFINLGIRENIAGSICGLSLQNADLSHLSFKGVNLDQATLVCAKLVRADFREANMTGARLRLANLRGVNLGGARLETSNLQSALLIGADLTGAQLSGANLKEACLADADLSGANLTWADLESVDFVGEKMLWPPPGEDWAGYTNLGPARGITVEQLCEAFIYRSTKLPQHMVGDARIEAAIAESEARRKAGRDRE